MAALAEFVDLDARTFSGLPMPLTLRLPVRFSDEELLAFSRRVRPFQVERNAKGELEIMSPTGIKGASAAAYAIRVLGSWAEEPGGISVSSQGAYTLRDTSIRMADASWISEERWEGPSSYERERFARVSPDFVIEILSRSASRSELNQKMEMWITNGTGLAWMIDPFAAEVVVYRPGREPELLRRPEWVEAESVVAGFRLEMARFWEK